MTDETFLATLGTAFPPGKFGPIVPFYSKPDGTVDRERTLDNLKRFPLAGTFTPEQRAELLSGPPAEGRGARTEASGQGGEGSE